MLGAIKKRWELAKIGSAIEGVVRATANGNGDAVRQWYYDYLVDRQEFARKHGNALEEVYALAMQLTGPCKAAHDFAK